MLIIKNCYVESPTFFFNEVFQQLPKITGPSAPSKGAHVRITICKIPVLPEMAGMGRHGVDVFRESRHKAIRPSGQSNGPLQEALCYSIVSRQAG